MNTLVNGRQEKKITAEREEESPKKGIRGKRRKCEGGQWGYGREQSILYTLNTPPNSNMKLWRRTGQGRVMEALK